MKERAKKKKTTLEKKLLKFQSFGDDPELFHQQLGQIAAKSKANRYVGWISDILKFRSRTTYVHFRIPGHGWSSEWPDWALEAAIDAFRYKRRITVYSEGRPAGENLLLVIVSDQDASHTH